LNKFINIDRVEFIVTYQCNSHCKHCQLGEEKRGREPSSINCQLASQIVKEVARENSPTSVMTFGGEPLLFPEVVCAIHEAAKDSGIGIREVITNAGVPRSEARFQVLANRLAESGVTHAAVSVDSFHQEYIPVSIIEHNVRSLLDVGISVGWNPCWVVSEKDTNPWNERTRAILSELAHILPLTESDEGNIVQPAGNALNWLSGFIPSKTIDPKGSCEDVPYANRLDKVTNLSIEPDGSVAVCKELYIGNAGQRDILEILRNYNPHQIPEMRSILQGSVSQMAELAYARGVEPEPNGYYSICDMCLSLRRKLASL